MALPLVTVTASVSFADGEVPTSAKLRFTPSAVDVSGDDILLPSYFEAPITAGEASVDVYPTAAGRGITYLVQALVVVTEGGRQVERSQTLAHQIQIPDEAGPFTLAALLNLDALPPISQTTLAQMGELLGETQDARDEAVAAAETVGTLAEITPIAAEIDANRVLAEAARDAAIAAGASAGTYPTLLKGETEVGEGGFFWSPEGADDGYLQLYEVVAGVATPQVGIVQALASVVQGVVEEMAETVRLTGAQIIAGEKTFSDTIRVPFGGSVDMGGQVMDAQDGNWRWGVTGSGDKPIVAVGDDGDVHFASGQTSFELLMASRNAANLARAAAIGGPHNDRVPHFDKDAALILAAGQSLAEGAQGFPALTRTPRAGCKMIGQSVRASYTGSDPTVFVGIGGNSLQDLIATTDSGSWPRTVLSQAAEAALAPSAGNAGEASVVSATHRLADQIQRRGRVLPELVAINCAVGGKTIAELSDGASPNYYGQIPSGIAAFKSLEDAASRSSEVVAVLFAQGENDYVAGTAKAAYKASLAAWWTKVKADVVAATGQTMPPALIMYQTSQYGSLDAAEMSISTAQLEFMWETTGVYMAGPVWPYVQKSIHLTANSYRQFGNQQAKVMARVLLDRRGWRPVSPLWAEQVGTKIYVGWHVPAPPLRWGTPYRFYTAQNPASDVTKGFRVSDDDGFVSVSGVRILNDTVVELTCSTAPGDGAKVWHGRTPYGDGYLCDSDGYLSDDAYEYDAASGQASSENIAALVDEPYDLANWATTFCLPATWSLS